MLLYSWHFMYYLVNCCMYCRIHISVSTLCLWGCLYLLVFSCLDFEVYNYFIAIYGYESPCCSKARSPLGLNSITWLRQHTSKYFRDLGEPEFNHVIMRRRSAAFCWCLLLTLFTPVLICCVWWVSSLSPFARGPLLMRFISVLGFLYFFVFFFFGTCLSLLGPHESWLLCLLVTTK